MKEINEKLYEIIKSKAESDFVPSKIDKWITKVPEILSFEPFKNLLQLNLSENEFTALKIILRHKYVFGQEPNKQFDKKFEQAISKDADLGDYLYLMEDKSRIFDFSGLKNSPTQIHLEMCRNAESIKLSESNILDTLILGCLPKLTSIENIENHKQISFLEVQKCNKLDDFSFIKSLTNIVYLNISENKNLKNLSFLTDKHKIICLFLVAIPGLLKNEDNIHYLKQLKYLKELRVMGSATDRDKLRAELPNVII